MERIYLDNNATTALDPRVLDAMQSDLGLLPANPSSIHSFGQEARARLTKARSMLAAYFHVKPHELIFTSGGTEAINMVLKGLFPLFPNGHIISTRIEHSAVYEVIQLFESRGAHVTYLPVGPLGAPTPKQVSEAITEETKLIALSAANSETGVLLEMEEIAKIALKHNLFFFVDAVALLGKMPLTIPDGVLAMSFSGHKIHAPKGSGLAFVRAPCTLTPLLHGGGQENGRRSGTENLAAITGLAKGVEILYDIVPAAGKKMGQLRDHFESELKKIFPPLLINGEGPRLPNTSNLSFPGFSGEELLMQLDLQGIAASHGSACASGAQEPSRVLQNMGYPKARAASAIRFSLSRNTTEEEINRTLSVLGKVLLHPSSSYTQTISKVGL